MENLFVHGFHGLRGFSRIFLNFPCPSVKSVSSVYRIGRLRDEMQPNLGKNKVSGLPVAEKPAGRASRLALSLPITL